MSDKRLRIESEHTFEEGVTFVADVDRLRISVAEEQAVDSYNQSFECSIHLTPEQTRELIAWLNERYPTKDSQS